MDDKKTRANVYELKVTEHIERIILNCDSNENKILVGVIHDYMQFEDISTQYFEDTYSCNFIHFPKVEGLRILRTPGGVNVFQIDDIYRIEDIEELIKFGIKRMIILGDVENFNDFSVKYFQETSSILISNFGSRCFVYGFHDLFDFKIRSFLGWNRFLHEQIQTSASSKQQQLERVSATETFWRKKTEEAEEWPTSGPVSRWQNWKQKADILTRPGQITESTVGNISYQIGLKFLTRQRVTHLKQRKFTSAIEDEKDIAKITSIIGKLNLNYYLYTIHGSVVFDVFSKFWKLQFLLTVVAESSSYSGRCFLNGIVLSTISQATTALYLNPYLKGGYRLIDVAVVLLKCISSAIEKDMKLPLDDERKKLLDQLTEEDVKKGEIKRGLRSSKSDEILQPGKFSGAYGDSKEMQAIVQKRIEYTQKIKTAKHRNDEMIEYRKILADSLSDVAHETLTLKFEIDTSDLNIYWSVLISFLEDIGKYSICCALEALEWNPDHEKAKKVFKKSSRLFIFLADKLEIIAKKIGKENFFSNHLMSLRSPITAFSPDAGSHCGSGIKKTSSFANYRKTIDIDLWEKMNDDVDTKRKFVSNFLLLNRTVKSNFIAAQRRSDRRINRNIKRKKKQRGERRIRRRFWQRIKRRIKRRIKQRTTQRMRRRSERRKSNEEIDKIVDREETNRFSLFYMLVKFLEFKRIVAPQMREEQNCRIDRIIQSDSSEIDGERSEVWDDIQNEVDTKNDFLDELFFLYKFMTRNFFATQRFSHQRVNQKFKRRIKQRSNQRMNKKSQRRIERRISQKMKRRSERQKSSEINYREFDKLEINHFLMAFNFINHSEFNSFFDIQTREKNDCKYDRSTQIDSAENNEERGEEWDGKTCNNETTRQFFFELLLHYKKIKRDFLVSVLCPDKQIIHKIKGRKKQRSNRRINQKIKRKRKWENERQIRQRIKQKSERRKKDEVNDKVDDGDFNDLLLVFMLIKFSDPVFRTLVTQIREDTFCQNSRLVQNDGSEINDESGKPRNEISDQVREDINDEVSEEVGCVLLDDDVLYSSFYNHLIKIVAFQP